LRHRRVGEIASLALVDVLKNQIGKIGGARGMTL
jgi:hypothetical protein